MIANAVSSPGTKKEQARFQLFQFSVPGLPGNALAVGLLQIVEVTSLSAITPVPFAPECVLGVSTWRGRVIGVIDLSSVLLHLPAVPQTSTPWHYLVAQTILDDQIEIVAWPILSNATTVTVPANMPAAEALAGLDSPAVFATLDLEGKPVALLDIEQLVRQAIKGDSATAG